MPNKALCFLLSAAACFGQAGSDADKFATVDGVVNHALTGEPMVRTHVILRGNGAMGNQKQYGAQTTAEGKFSITGMLPGNYQVTAERTGYVMPTGAELRIVVALKEKDTKSVKLKLIPTGAIAGRVTDAEGEPVEGATVSAEGAMTETATADEQGRYRIGGLPPGKYRVRASVTNSLPLGPEMRTDGTEEVHYAATYYPGTLVVKEAARVEVRTGVDSGGADIHLARVPFVRVSGRVEGLPLTGRAFVVAQQNGAQAGSRRWAATAQVKADGSFEMWRLDPGKYQLYASTNGNDRTNESEVEVAGSNVDNVSLRVVPESEIPGTIEFDDDAARQIMLPPPPAQGAKPVPPPRRALTLYNINASGPGASATIEESGVFTIKKLAAGRYMITLSPGSLYVKSVRLGAAVMDNGVLDISNGSGGAALSIRVSSATGSLSGAVLDDSGRAAGTRVILLRQDIPAGADEMMARTYATAGPDGRYQFTNRPPGTYKVIAVQESDTDIILQRGSLDEYEDQMEAVEIHPGDKIEKDLKRRAPAQR